jgi:hypothetical protein
VQGASVKYGVNTVITGSDGKATFIAKAGISKITATKDGYSASLDIEILPSEGPTGATITTRTSTKEEFDMITMSLLIGSILALIIVIVYELVVRPRRLSS